MLGTSDVRSLFPDETYQPRSLARIRTWNLPVNSRLLCQLSYERLRSLPRIRTWITCTRRRRAASCTKRDRAGTTGFEPAYSSSTGRWRRRSACEPRSGDGIRTRDLRLMRPAGTAELPHSAMVPGRRLRPSELRHLTACSIAPASRACVGQIVRPTETTIHDLGVVEHLGSASVSGRTPRHAALRAERRPRIAYRSRRDARILASASAFA